jgi:hypothetical protein
MAILVLPRQPAKLAQFLPEERAGLPIRRSRPYTDIHITSRKMAMHGRA